MSIIENGLETKVGTFCLLRKEGKTLMMHRDVKGHFMYDKWTPPGGKFKPEDNNDPEKCVRRENHEEPGVELLDLQYRGVLFFDNKNRNFGGKPAKFNFVVYVFEAYDFTGQVKDRCEEGEFHWIYDSNLKNLNMEKGDEHIFKLLDEKKPLWHRVILLGDKEVKMESLPSDFEPNRYFT